MPTINKPEKKKKTYERKETDMRKLRQQAYQTTEWRRLRDVYMRQHPVCEECLNQGKVTPATDIHHLISPFQHGEINYKLLYDYDNLMALCKECHGNLHAAQQGHVSPEEVLKQLDDLFNENISDEDLEK
jgi:5-methylcytosine-specific restriction protein A